MQLTWPEKSICQELEGVLVIYFLDPAFSGLVNYIWRSTLDQRLSAMADHSFTWNAL